MLGLCCWKWKFSSGFVDVVVVVVVALVQTLFGRCKMQITVVRCSHSQQQQEAKDKAWDTYSKMGLKRIDVKKKTQKVCMKKCFQTVLFLKICPKNIYLFQSIFQYFSFSASRLFTNHKCNVKGRCKKESYSSSAMWSIVTEEEEGKARQGKARQGKGRETHHLIDTI